MGVIIVDGSTVRSFVDNEPAFNKSITDRFAALDLNGDGVLSRSELRRALETFRLAETHFGADVVAPPGELAPPPGELAAPPGELAALYDSIFEQFDCDHSGTVDLPEFRAEMRRILLAIADGLGSAPIQMAVEDDDAGENFLQKAADLEAEEIRKRAK